jgi:RNA polymerase sigma factor (sigma-70 family)
MPTQDGVIFVIDDDPSVLRSLRRRLELARHAVETYASAEAFLQREPFEGPGCVIADLRLPGMQGSDLHSTLRQIGCKMPLILISGHGEISDAVKAMKDGAIDFLEKPLDSKTLLSAIGRALEQCREMQAQQAEVDQAQQRLSQLTQRERQVCELVAEGLRNKQIADRLGTSEKTVKAQRGSAMKKLNAGSTAGLLDLLRLSANH